MAYRSVTLSGSEESFGANNCRHNVGRHEDSPRSERFFACAQNDAYWAVVLRLVVTLLLRRNSGSETTPGTHLWRRMSSFSSFRTPQYFRAPVAACFPLVGYGGGGTGGSAAVGQHPPCPDPVEPHYGACWLGRAAPCRSAAYFSKAAFTSGISGAK